MISPAGFNQKRFAKSTRISTRFLRWIQPDFKVVCLFDQIFCRKICLFKTDGWHIETEFLATQKTSISENYCHFKL